MHFFLAIIAGLFLKGAIWDGNIVDAFLFLFTFIVGLGLLPMSDDPQEPEE